MKNETASSPTESGCTGVSKPVPRKGIIHAYDFVGLRKRPSAMYGYVMGVGSGTPVTILEEDAGFYKVSVFNGIIGYVPCAFVQEVSVDA